MKIQEKILMDRQGLEKYGPINIVAFGDSVTHGAVGPGEIDYESVYWNRLRKKIVSVRSYVPVNVINAGIGGTTAALSVERTENQVLVHNPDLVIVCFGLNDVCGTLKDYTDSLEKIFGKCKKSGTLTVFMTPNMLNTYVANDTEPMYRDYAKLTAQIQNGGRMDEFMNSACDIARSMDVTVCDCYAKWKALAKTKDTTLLLANRINHPLREMHSLFADSLFDAVFKDTPFSESKDESTMYKQNDDKKGDHI